jgi:hypothetical protein
MKANRDKIDDAVLGLLHLTSFTEGRGELAFTRAWKVSGGALPRRRYGGRGEGTFTRARKGP